MSQKSVAAVLIQADRRDEAHRRFTRLCKCAPSDAVCRVLRGVIIRVYFTRIVETSNARIATKHQKETAKLVIWSPVPPKSPAAQHEATPVATDEPGNGLPHEEESA
jgi:hypothetical protein